MTKFDLQLFADNTNTTLSAGMAHEVKEYYDKKLMDRVAPELVHDQFADKSPLPKNGGKSIEFRRFETLPAMTTPLTEGVTPDGQSLTVTKVSAPLRQYGGWVQTSDVLNMTAIDKVTNEAAGLVYDQAALTLDCITRDVINAGTTRVFAPTWSGTTPTDVATRDGLDETAVLKMGTVDEVVTYLDALSTPKFDGYYVAIVHPYVRHDLMKDPDFKSWNQYQHAEKKFKNEIGVYGGVRFVVSANAKMIAPEEMFGIAGYRRTTLQAAASAATSVKVNDVFTTTQATAINAAITAGAEYDIYIDGHKYRVASVTGGAAGTCAITINTDTTLSYAATVTAAKGAVVCGYGAGAKGATVFCTPVFGRGAYGVSELEGGGLEQIMKQLGYGDDPLNQRSSVGWKASRAVTIKQQERIIRIESGSSAPGAKTAGSN